MAVIRGVVLSLQVMAQAVGPLLSGVLRDWKCNYTDLLLVFGVLAALAAVTALAARRPLAPPSRGPQAPVRWTRTRRRQRFEETGFWFEDDTVGNAFHRA